MSGVAEVHGPAPEGGHGSAFRSFSFCVPLSQGTHCVFFFSFYFPLLVITFPGNQENSLGQISQEGLNPKDDPVPACSFLQPAHIEGLLFILDRNPTGLEPNPVVVSGAGTVGGDAAYE